MAYVSQGITVAWGGVTLGEVVSVDLSGVSADTLEVTPRTSLDKVKVYSPADRDPGGLSVRVRGTAAMSTTNVTSVGSLSLGGPGISLFDGTAIFESLQWSASAGELQEYTVTFKLGGR
ncbi:MAG: hypothetical protein EBR82_45985 [Caulobacteraceae bacterium]|nr:hypothetical protein [Caulobacteraceae bacterium]